MILAATITSTATTSQTTANPNYIYLSDISYLTDKSFAQSGYSILLDKNKDSDFITLNVNGKVMPFLKGICAWATSEIVYDLTEYDYDYFTSYIGIDTSEQSDYFNTGAKFYIYTSKYGDGGDFITAAMINLFEDITKEEVETPEDIPEEIPIPDEEDKPEEVLEETITLDEEEKLD